MGFEWHALVRPMSTRHGRRWGNPFFFRHFGIVALSLLPSVGVGQAVMLRIRPHLGDTLRMKMEQRIEMSDDSVDAGASPMVAVMCVYTRAVAVHSSGDVTDLESITDSVTVMPASAATLPLFVQTKRLLEGKAVKLRVASNGGISVASARDGRFTQRVPAMLPDKRVARGDEWARDMDVPMSATHASTGSVRVRFRLDSLSHDDAVAYVSMRGTFSHEHPRDSSEVRHDETRGTIDGTMQVDRRLEWVTDSRMTVILLSTVRLEESEKPTRVHMKVTQSMRAMPRR